MPKYIELRTFRTALISSLMPVAAVVLLLRMFWGTPDFRLWGIVGVVIILAVVFFQLGLLYSVHKEARSAIAATNDPVLKRTMNMLMRTFNWGNALVMIVVVLVFEFMRGRS
ncbi:MAG TPA: hypothetical protein VHT24_14610 [Pseudacidobacterium sp.]|nr:hypothetical protein [Pseudacidobacterium sp.]